jgi:hypothetical protein
MENNLAVPSHDDVNELKEQIAEHKRALEYKKLKEDLADITMKAANTPNDIDGAMQMPDTDQVLTTKRIAYSVIEKIISRAAKMCAVQPIIGNIIALILPILAVAMLSMLNALALKHDISWVEKALPYLTKSSIVAISGVVLISAARSLLLPLLGMVLAVTFCSILQGSETIFHYSFNDFLILGVASFVAAMFSALAIR